MYSILPVNTLQFPISPLNHSPDLLHTIKNQSKKRKQPNISLYEDRLPSCKSNQQTKMRPSNYSELKFY